MEWQPLHKVSTAQPEYYDDDFTYESTPEGLELAHGSSRRAVGYDQRTPFELPEAAGPPPDADGTYEIEEIVGATRRGRTWYIEIKWVGWRDTTEETRAWLLANATPVVIQEMRDAIARAVRGESQSTTGTEQQSSDDEDYETGTTGVDDTGGQAFLSRYITVPLARTFYTRLTRMSMLY